MTQRPLGDDLLVGVAAIAQYLSISERRIYHWADRGYITTFKIGPLIAARRSQLDQALQQGGPGEG
jgi:hypothetical protein